MLEDEFHSQDETRLIQYVPMSQKTIVELTGTSLYGEPR